MSKPTPADKVAYELLIQSIADQVPNTVCGKPGLEQMPQLKPADIALVCRNYALEVNEHLIDEDLDRETALIMQGDFCALGALRALALENACRRAVAYDVMNEIERRETFDNIEADTIEWVRGPLEESL